MKILFIGNFLSAHRGTIGPMEGVMERIKTEYKIIKASSYNNEILKLADMIIKSVFCRYKTIHIDTYSSRALWFAIITATIGNLRRKKVILNLHGGGLYNRYKQDGQKQKQIKSLFTKASVLVSPSLYLCDCFGKEGYTIKYLPNSIDTKRFPYNPDHVNNHCLLWVRAFNSTYQPWLAVKTLYEVKKKYPDATLTMIGPDKGLLEETKQLIADLDLTDCVDITGKIPNQELWKYYHSHSIYLNTTNTESFGVAVMEAASCGIPIVSTSVGELGYLWENEENALLIQTFDEKDFAKAVCRYIKDEALYVSIKKKAFLKAQEFVWENIKRHWINILD